MISFNRAHFLKSAAKLTDLPEDVGIEVAFVGRSNAGKSSALNTLTQQKSLARVSKTPGRTQLINLFQLDESRRLVDLPGYGFAKVSAAMKREWQRTLSDYLAKRDCLHGLVLVMDSRRPFQKADMDIVHWTLEHKVKLHLLLTKVDKHNQKERSKAQRLLEATLEEFPGISAQFFSATKKTGLEKLKIKLTEWLESTGSRD